MAHDPQTYPSREARCACPVERVEPWDKTVDTYTSLFFSHKVGGEAMGSVDTGCMVALLANRLTWECPELPSYERLGLGNGVCG